MKFHNSPAEIIKFSLLFEFIIQSEFQSIESISQFCGDLWASKWQIFMRILVSGN